MAAQQSSQQPSQPHKHQVRGRMRRWLLRALIIVIVLAVLSFIVPTIFWIGLVHDRPPDIFGAIFTSSGTIFSFAGLILGAVSIILYLRDRREAMPPIQVGVSQNSQQPVVPFTQDGSGSQVIPDAGSSFGPDTTPQRILPPARHSQQQGNTPVDQVEFRLILSECNETTFNGVVSRMKRKGLKRGILPPSSAPQGQRADVLVDWADSDAGPGINVLYNAYLDESGKFVSESKVVEKQDYSEIKQVIAKQQPFIIIPIYHARIVTHVANSRGLTNFADDKIMFQVYKLTIQEIFNILNGRGGFDLNEITLDDIQDYTKGLQEISSGFYDLYRRGKIWDRGFEPNIIQPLIDQAGTKLSVAATLKRKGDEEGCLNKLKEGKLLLFHLVELLVAIKFE